MQANICELSIGTKNEFSWYNTDKQLGIICCNLKCFLLLLETMADVIHDHDYSQQIGAVRKEVPDTGKAIPIYFIG